MDRLTDRWTNGWTGRGDYIGPLWINWDPKIKNECYPQKIFLENQDSHLYTYKIHIDATSVVYKQIQIRKNYTNFAKLKLLLVIKSIL